jgi:hypothetical protein
LSRMIQACHIELALPHAKKSGSVNAKKWAPSAQLTSAISILPSWRETYSRTFLERLGLIPGSLWQNQKYMLVSELIERLQALLAEHGDLRVRIESERRNPGPKLAVSAGIKRKSLICEWIMRKP